MESLNAYFESLGPKQCVTAVGCGGKTSLIRYLAQNRKQLKTLVATTTKMAVPLSEDYDYLRDYSGDHLSFPPASPGITIGGRLGNERKLQAIPLDILEEIVPDFDYVLIEGDGSRNLPLKAWADYEPVVPSCTTITVGILPVWTLGKPVSETIVHRLPLFTALTGAQPGEIITFQHLVSVITGNYPSSGKGLFSAAQGKRILFFNQVETETAMSRAKELASLIPPGFRSRLHSIIAGSVQQGSVA
ncbi:MAG: putative selenium-dependent hydroxylase accessory protein YqeC [Treponema sp.]|jgi:probable selenium-dependent hydroxylase accessory protein YqeC|nr:putative selenium-dependent hydroxylase accessory protein YqeC [Treponema sp.]